MLMDVFATFATCTYIGTFDRPFVVPEAGRSTRLRIKLRFCAMYICSALVVVIWTGTYVLGQFEVHFVIGTEVFCLCCPPGRLYHFPFPNLPLLQTLSPMQRSIWKY